jgi:hypothetical protein
MELILPYVFGPLKTRVFDLFFKRSQMLIYKFWKIVEKTVFLRFLPKKRSVKFSSLRQNTLLFQKKFIVCPVWDPIYRSGRYFPLVSHFGASMLRTVGKKRWNYRKKLSSFKKRGTSIFENLFFRKIRVVQKMTFLKFRCSEIFDPQIQF